MTRNKISKMCTVMYCKPFVEFIILYFKITKTVIHMLSSTSFIPIIIYLGSECSKHYKPIKPENINILYFV